MEAFGFITDGEVGPGVSWIHHANSYILYHNDVIKVILSASIKIVANENFRSTYNTFFRPQLQLFNFPGNRTK